VLLAVEQHGATTLADFYTRQLAAYLEQPRSFWFWLMPDTQMRRRMTRELAGLNRYLTDQEQEVAERLFRTIRVKDELDYQHALQWMLKMWLFVHLALSYALLLCVIGHIILVHAFHGGWR
jgi:hypothetical protein